MRGLRSTTVTVLLAIVATTAATRVDGARRVRVRWEAYRTAAEYVDPRDSPEASNAMTVVRVDAVPGAPITLRGSLDGQLAEDRLVMEARAADGTVLFQTVIPDPRVLRTEAGSEGRLSGRVLYRTRVEFDVTVPDDPAIAELRFFSPRWTREGWQRTQLGNGLGLVTLGGGPPPPPPPPGGTTAWPVTKIVDNGDSEQRLDLVILGDGYTSDQLRQYAGDVKKLVKGLFSQRPFSEYRRYFNVHRVDVTSPQSGADHPSRGVLVNTALDAAYDCTGIQRLICIDYARAKAFVQDSLPQVQADLTVVLVNDKEYGGSGGEIAVASTHPDSVELVLHETGHSFGSLADEYGGPPPPSCVDDVEPFELNATRQSRATDAKWSHWIDAGVRGCKQDDAATLCPGARYCDSTLFRPTKESKMRALGHPFHAVNGEQLVKRVYNRLSPIDAVSPAATTLTVKGGASQAFTVTTPKPSTHQLSIAWTLDGVKQAATGSLFTFAAPTAPGLHKVKVAVKDATDMVRMDPDQLLTDSREWDVTVTP